MVPEMDIKDLGVRQVREWFAKNAIAPFHADQCLRWIYQRQAEGFQGMSDLSKKTRDLLQDHFHNDRLALVRTAAAADGTRKFLFGLKDGHTVETVLIPEKAHYTLCISSQVGCAQGCRFCLTARGGLVRNLSCGEIVSQIRDVQRQLLPDDMPLTNIVLMGMGEPLANYRHVVAALAVITHAGTGMMYSNRRVTLSTAGMVPGILALGRDTDVNLAVSLNAADNRTRDRLMPINRRYPIEALLEACARFPLNHRRRITIEYVLMQDVNDTPEDAHRLAKRLTPLRVKINLIPFNPHPGSPFKTPSETAVVRFQEILIQKHFTVMVRKSKGRDISAACGQLRAAQAVRDSKAAVRLIPDTV